MLKYGIICSKVPWEEAAGDGKRGGPGGARPGSGGAAAGRRRPGTGGAAA